MTPRQRLKLMTALWPNAAAANHWHPRDRTKRLAIINEVLAQHPHPTRRRVITSASELDSNTDYTLVKNRLLLLADSLAGACEDGDLTANAARQRREVIRQLVKRLAETFAHADPLKNQSPPESFMATAENYVRKIIHDTAARAGFGPENFARATFEQILSALELPALDRLLITLKNRLHTKRAHRL
jgi:hypothetical protein